MLYKLNKVNDSSKYTYIYIFKSQRPCSRKIVN